MGVSQPGPLGPQRHTPGLQTRVYQSSSFEGTVLVNSDPKISRPASSPEERDFRPPEEEGNLRRQRLTDQTSSLLLLPHSKEARFLETNINLKPLNKAYIRPKRFRMETLAVVLSSLQRGSWATSIDLKDAYLHIPIHPSHHRFLAFRYRNVDFCFRALPFGLSTAPRVFTRVTKVVLAFLRRQGIHVFTYLDDWLLVGRSAQETSDLTTYTVSLLENLGWIVNVEKSSLIPTQTITYLGAILDFRTGTASPSPQRVLTLSEMATDMFSRSNAPARTWFRLLGLMANMVDVISFCRLFMRPIQIHLLEYFSPSWSPLSKRVSATSIRQRSPTLVDESTQYSLRETVQGSQTQVNDHDRCFSFRMGSSLGVGDPVRPMELERLLPPHQPPGTYGRFPSHLQMGSSPQEPRGINPVRQLHDCFVHQPSGRNQVHLPLHQDLGSPSPLPSLQHPHKSLPSRRPGECHGRGNLQETEWSLSQVWANHIFQIYDKPMLDLFPTPSNAKLPVFCTRYFHPQAWSTDALAITWDNLYAYAFPPWCLIQRVLLKLRESNTVLLLVAPYWPNQPGFPLLLEMLIDYPFRFQLRTNLLTQAGGKIWHQRLQHLSLAAWKLSPNVSLVKDFHRKLQSSPQVPADPLPCQLTTLDWSGLETGPPRKVSIPWMHQ